MENKHAIVIDAQGNKTEFVLASQNEEGKYIPHHYVLQAGESLVFEEVPTALSMLKPRWSGSNWMETATPEEIEAAKPEPQEQTGTPAPSLTQLAEDIEVLQMAVAELYESTL